MFSYSDLKRHKASLVAQLVKNPPAMWETRVGKIPWRREQLPTPVFWLGEFHGLYSSWGHKVSDTTDPLSLTYTCIYSFSDSFLTYVVTEYWVEISVLCSSCLLALYFIYSSAYLGFPSGSDSQESTCNVGHPGSIPASGRSPGGEHGSPLQYSCPETPMDRGAWRAAVHRVSKLDRTESLSTVCIF